MIRGRDLGIGDFILVLAFVLALLPAGRGAYAADPVSLNQLGLDQLRAGNCSGAADLFRMAIEADPEVKYYYNNLAVSCMRMGDYREAEKHLRSSLRIDMNYTRALANMAVTLFHLGRYSESYRYYRLARKSDSKYTDNRFDRKRISSAVKKKSEENPGDGDLNRIRKFIEENDSK